MAWAGAAMADEGLAGSAAAALGRAQDSPGALAGGAITLQRETYPGSGDAGGAIQYLDLTGWLTPRRASSLGLTLGVVPDGPGGAGEPLRTLAAYDLGVRWRSRLDRNLRLDVHAWARTPQRAAAHDTLGMIWLTEQDAFGTRVEVQWSTAPTHGLTPEFGAIGLRLQGDSRLLLRTRRGGPMLYYRAKF